MGKSKIKVGMIIASLFVTLALAFSFLAGCGKEPTNIPISESQPELWNDAFQSASEEIRATMVVQDRHTDQLLALKGVVGTATGLTPDGKPAIKVFTLGPVVAGIPRDLEGVPVIVEVTGEIIAHVSGKDRFNRPVPIGVSVGNINECSAGTIGCGVEKGGARYLLTNNHVIARENKAAIGEDVVQPGRYDNKPKCALRTGDRIGDLSDFEPIVFSTSASNIMDAAIAISSTANLGCSTWTPAYGFPSSNPVEAALNMAVQKVGRTTGYTTATVTGINVTVNVGYPSGTARFVDQIQISGSNASKSGDSGSLWVTNNVGKNPVGLNFAGDRSGSISISNRIIPVLNRFGVTVCGE